MDSRPVILVVDDDNDVREMIVEYLGGAGFSVLEAAGTEAMRARLAATGVDLLLLDRTMPDGDALRLIPGLRREHPHLAIVVVTALGQDEERVRGLDGGADDYLPKPFIWSELVARMRAVLRRVRPATAPVPATGGGTERAGGGPTRHRQAAILFADVEGFTRMMQADECTTLRVLRHYVSDLFVPQVAAAGGRIVKTLGDGIIATLPTAQQAIACACALQREVERNNARLPISRRLRFRIGINVAVVVETADGDVWGHGVNVAARLQTLAPPGGIVVSQSVHDDLGVDELRTLVDLGQHRLKNVHEPVQVFGVFHEGLELRRQNPDPWSAGETIDPPTVALPSVERQVTRTETPSAELQI